MIKPIWSIILRWVLLLCCFLTHPPLSSKQIGTYDTILVAWYYSYLKYVSRDTQFLKILAPKHTTWHCHQNVVTTVLDQFPTPTMLQTRTLTCNKDLNRYANEKETRQIDTMTCKGPRLMEEAVRGCWWWIVFDDEDKIICKALKGWRITSIYPKHVVIQKVTDTVELFYVIYHCHRWN